MADNTSRSGLPYIHASGVNPRAKLLSENGDPGEPAPDVDLLVRTGGEQRLSDFLLWEMAYAELQFTPTMWPDFEIAELRRIIDVFHSTERRFGAIPAPAAKATG